LRQLVQFGLTQEAPERRHARQAPDLERAIGSPRRQRHSPELVQNEIATSTAYPYLPEKYRSAAEHEHKHTHNDQDRHQQDKPGAGQ
jgi:hypothetical protein